MSRKLGVAILTLLAASPLACYGSKGDLPVAPRGGSGPPPAASEKAEGDSTKKPQQIQNLQGPQSDMKAL